MNKLIVFDMDGVIFQHDNFWMRLHEAWGTLEEGTRLTNLYLKTDMKRLAKEVISKLWKGKNEAEFRQLIETAKYNPGVKETIDELKRREYQLAILTSGPIHLAQRTKDELGIDNIYGNELIFKDGKATGEYNWLSLDYKYKGESFLNICKELNVNTKDTIVIGDNDQDKYKFKEAGISIAFNTKSEELKKIATHVVEGNDLKEILEFV